jgi:hypothetical protein
MLTEGLCKPSCRVIDAVHTEFGSIWHTLALEPVNELDRDHCRDAQTPLLLKEGSLCCPTGFCNSFTCSSQWFLACMQVAEVDL